jgi:hypothetical protein
MGPLTAYIDLLISVPKAHADQSKSLGLAFFVLIIVQVSLGTAVKWIKRRPAKSAINSGRGPLNYLHVATGLAVMAIGFAAVYTGMSIEWPRYSGAGVVGTGWIAGWAVIVAVCGQELELRILEIADLSDRFRCLSCRSSAFASSEEKRDGDLVGRRYFGLLPSYDE